MILQFDDIICQTECMKSGEMRPGREDKYDAPLAPSKILFDDINHVTVMWLESSEHRRYLEAIVGFPSMKKPYYAVSSNKGYLKSHHIT